MFTKNISVSYLPWDPQSKSHNLELQSSPTQPSKQSHFWASRSKTPWPEQSGRHCLASSSKTPQSRPFQPFLQIQEPSTQNPWSEQVGSGQSTFWQKSPVKPFMHWHWPSSHRPRPEKLWKKRFEVFLWLLLSKKESKNVDQKLDRVHYLHFK